MAEFTAPEFYSDCLVMELRVEQAIYTISNTSNLVVREKLLLELHMHELDYPCPKLRRALQQLDAMCGHRPFAKSPTGAPPPPADLSPGIFKTKVRNPLNRERVEWVEVSMSLLYEWISTNFLPLCTKKYSWFALWCFLKDKLLLEDMTVSSFCTQMKKWFPNASIKPDRFQVNRYREPYLANHPYIEWKESEFVRLKKTQQSVDGFSHLKEICTKLASTFVVSRLCEVTDAPSEEEK